MNSSLLIIGSVRERRTTTVSYVASVLQFSFPNFALYPFIFMRILLNLIRNAKSFTFDDAQTKRIMNSEAHLKFSVSFRPTTSMSPEINRARIESQKRLINKC
jgi:hypothetical protein